MSGITLTSWQRQT